MNTGERLAQISGMSGVSAATMLMSIGSGSTAGELLVSYSGLSSGTAEEHLLASGAPVTSIPLRRVFFYGFGTRR